jgi:acyl-CoA thioester hydrolase
VEVLHRTVVAPEEIDHLGHMNVHFYAVHAREGADRLLASIGMAQATSERPTSTVAQRDIYVRHHREQREGAALEVRGGVLDAGPGGVRLYQELANADDGELAATFVLAFELLDADGGEPRALPADVLAAADARRVELPEHGRWRSISPDADVVGTAPSLDLLVERDLAHRKVRTLGPLPGGGGHVSDLPIAELVWGGEPVPGRAFQPLHALPEGGHMGFATLETRATWARWPRADDRVQAFGAEVERSEKTMLTRNWVYDVDRSALVAVFSVVNVAFDTTTRRAIPIPDELRRRWDARLHTDLA